MGLLNKIFGFKGQEEIKEEELGRKEELLKSLILFPGSVEEYATFRGYDVEVVNIKRPNKGVCFGGVCGLVPDRELIIRLVDEENVEALLNVCPLLVAGTSYYGLPVRRKQ